MPASTVDFSQVTRALTATADTTTTDSATTPYSTVISTPNGLAIIEIQGDLTIPNQKPAGLTAREEALFAERQVPDIFHGDQTELMDVVRFGRLELDDTHKRATLFISTTQRLLGTVEKIDPPLGVLKVQSSPDSPEQHCEVVDLVHTKVVFRQRPLPIM